jgi:mannose-1-phosphate guanylyltransferase/phosphomannomutase
MKAVIMAGGKGVRLFPISAGYPKPLAPVFNIPVIDHIVSLLSAHGVKEAVATLQYMPEMIINYFEDSPPDDITVSFSVETEPKGTAGSVAACKDFIKDEDFIVISGDAVCDFNLTECFDFHRRKNADVTIILYRHPTPLEYGLVMTDSSDRIERFIEKPSWKQVFCDTVNTGVYIINPRVLDKIPQDRPFDFAKDLFPALLKEGYSLYGYTCDGYWKDIGDPAAYLECHLDILEGGVDIPACLSQVTSPYDSAAADLIPPVSIGKNVSIGKGSCIGPYAVIGDGSKIGENVVITNSVINSAFVGDNTEISNSVLCRDVTVGRDVVISDGCVLGEASRVEASTSLSPGVVLAPGESISKGRHITPALRGELLPIDDNGAITSENCNITAEYCLKLGEALSNLGSVAVGYGDVSSEIFASAISCGARYGGADVFRHDARFPAEAFFISTACGAEVSVYVTSENGVTRILLRRKYSMPLTRENERKLILAMRSETVRENGMEKFIIGTQSIYEDSFKVSKGDLRIWVEGSSIEDRVLESILKKNKCNLKGGASLTVKDNQLCLTLGKHGVLPYETVQALLAMVYFDSGERELLMSFDTPGAICDYAKHMGCTVLLESRDSYTDEHLEKSVMFRDGVRAAAELCNFMIKTGMQIQDMLAILPDFSVYTDELPLSRDRGAVMRALATISNVKEYGNGVRFPYKEGWVTVAPRTAAPSIRIVSEGLSMEAAKEICVEIKEAARKADSQI